MLDVRCWRSQSRLRLQPPTSNFQHLLAGRRHEVVERASRLVVEALVEHLQRADPIEAEAAERRPQLAPGGERPAEPQKKSPIGRTTRSVSLPSAEVYCSRTFRRDSMAVRSCGSRSMIVRGTWKPGANSRVS